MQRKMCNIGILAHVDAGKTTLTEQMLFASGALRAAGSVDSGTAQTDWLQVERGRGISVRSSSVVLEWKDVSFHLIDTPGHADFAGEVERALQVLDGALLLVSAVEGVQAYTELLWEALRALGLPAVVMINKIDRAGADVQRVQDELSERFGNVFFPLNRPVNSGSRDCSVEPVDYALPGESEELTALLAEYDDGACEAYLEGRPLAPETLLATARRLCGQGKLFPVVAGAAQHGVGVSALLDVLSLWLPGASGDEAAPVSGVVYKVEHDRAMGKAAHVRLFTGCIRNRDSVRIAGVEQKVTQIRRVFAGRQSDVGEIRAGEIAALYGLSSARTGDLVGAPAVCRPPQLAAPLLKVQAAPEDPARLPELVQALGELSEEDPLLDLEWVPEERELHLKITGPIQLEILSALLRDRYGLTVSFTPPSVIYKETPSRAGEGYERYTMPKPCWAVLRFAIEPGPRGSGLQYHSEVGERALLKRYQNHVAQCLPEALRQGLYGWEVTDLRVTLTGGEHHLQHTHPLDFFVATPMAILNGLQNTGTDFLEPMLQVRLRAQEELLGRVIGDVTQMRGSFDAPVLRGGQFILEAALPAAEALDYPTRFAVLTGGRGVYASRYAGYALCPRELAKPTKRRGVNPLDRAKWILHARQAL